MTQHVSPFIEENVDPLLLELPGRISLQHAGLNDPNRFPLQQFIQTIFFQAYKAEVNSFHPNLIGFGVRDELAAVVGYRHGQNASFFCEQYLDEPAHVIATARLRIDVDRGSMVEVGNLSIADPGHARWIIAASTAMLAGAGHRWVVFTATRQLANAFQRLGLKPFRIGLADPLCLPDSGMSWGSYYRTRPAVYVGDIHAGLAKLRSTRTALSDRLTALLQTAHLLGMCVSCEGRNTLASDKAVGA